MFQIQGIDHVALSVRDLDEALQFYTKVLGLRVTQREYSKPGIEYFLDCGPSLIGLIQGDAQTGGHLFQDQGIGANHFSLRVKTAEFDEIVKRLKAHAVKILFEKKREKSWSVYFQDPDGNKIEMTAWPQEDGK